MEKSKVILIGAVAFVIALTIGFSVGIRYRRPNGMRGGWATRTFAGRSFGPMMGYDRFPGNYGLNHRGYLGQVTSVSGNQLTIKLFDGREEKIILSGSTTYTKTSVVGQADIKVGENIAVLGQSAADGSINANAIRIGAQ